MSVLQELKPIKDYHAFNAARWEEVIADPALEALEQRIETNRHGIILMSPNPGVDHGGWQCDVGFFLRTLLPDGKALTECPISTSEGVKLADNAWISRERLAKSRRKNVFVIAPEICAEVISPTNRRGEIEEKKRLYFEGGAGEVWIVGLKGHLDFFHRDDRDTAQETSPRCPDFPRRLEAF